MGSSTKNSQTKPDDLKPVDWKAVEPHFRAGIRSLKSIGIEFGVSPPAILKHFLKRGVTRNLKARIHIEAQSKVNAAAVNAPVNAAGVHQERAIVDANANVLASVQIGHRIDIARARHLANSLTYELGEIVDRPEVFGMIFDALSHPDEPAIDALRDMARLVASLPSRVKVMKDLAETLHRLVGMEREAFGLDTASGTDGLPTVIIHDYTGRGDVDSPFRGKPRPEPSAAETARLEHAMAQAADLGEDSSMLGKAL